MVRWGERLYDSHLTMIEDGVHHWRLDLCQGAKAVVLAQRVLIVLTHNGLGTSRLNTRTISRCRQVCQLESKGKIEFENFLSLLALERRKAMKTMTF